MTELERELCEGIARRNYAAFRSTECSEVARRKYPREFRQLPTYYREMLIYFVSEAIERRARS